MVVSPPVNLAPNSQWEIFSGVGYQTRMNPHGTGTLIPVDLLGNTVGSNEVTLNIAGDTGQWKHGDLIKIDGLGIDAALTSKPLRIRSISGNNIVVRCPFGLIPTTSQSGYSAVRPVNIGAAASLGTGDAADGWGKDINLQVWREDNDSNVLPGALYSLGCKKSSSNDQPLFMRLDAKRFRNRTITIGMHVYQKVRNGGGTWALFFNSGAVVVSRAAPPSSSFQWMEFSSTVPSDAEFLNAGIRFTGAPGDTYYVCNPVLAAGPEIGVGNYLKLPETLFPTVHLSCWINVSINFPATQSPLGSGAYSWPFDLYADTGGAVAKTVLRAEGCMEGVNDGQLLVVDGPRRLLGFSDRLSPPVKFGPFMPQIAPGAKSYATCEVPLFDGEAFVFSGKASDQWKNVSIDFDKFYLA